MPTQSTSRYASNIPSARTSLWTLIALRIAFLLALMGVGWGLVSDKRIVGGALEGRGDSIMVGFVVAALLFIIIDMCVSRKSLTLISGLFFGLVAGMVIAFGVSLIIDFLIEANVPGGQLSETEVSFVNAIKLGLGVVCCYLCVSFILQTKDDVRFVIPYVEFSRETKGGRPLILDTSVIIDGRVADIAGTRIFDSELVVPQFVLQELQLVADSSDKLRRTRGRRGLDMLNKLQTNDKVDIKILDVQLERSAAGAGVDEMLVDLAQQLDGKVVTNDYNLNKVAQFRGVPVININDLANALRPVVLPGEAMSIKVVKPGEEAGQGVGYLDDGTMVVAEGARERIGQNVELTVTSVLQTSAGRMIFGRMEGTSVTPRRRPRSPSPT